MSELSSHIPDFNLITYYSENVNTIFSKVSPWTKGIMLVLIIVFVTIARSLVLLAALYLLILLVYRMAGLPLRKLFQWYLLPLIFVLSLVIILMWNEPGRALFTIPLPFYPLTLTDGGAIMVTTLLLKALISVTYSLFFLMTTRYNYFSAMIYRIFPSPIDQIFLMSYRFIFITLSMIDTMLKALYSRGGGIIKSSMRQTGMFAEVFALTMIRSFDRADRVNKAMEARGFSGKYFAASQIPGIGLRDCAFMLVAIAIAAYLLYFVKLPL
ncbi:MAG TPA: energy-coupling factor transporter transmembrane component T [Methanocella sp.]|uniref:energy-coupling factor transporter transmembrane component T family protein n=1 Tax=Methanocella sp. TaxID=2052833 RepID=UPI002CCDFE41|nr:energy-coupling factor transporter transmembrane component T [Methanocella sp.]HTY89767.1 energy-coupling factor transporter transmembrane component T [Methanocella sp.]